MAVNRTRPLTTTEAQKACHLYCTPQTQQQMCTAQRLDPQFLLHHLNPFIVLDCCSDIPRQPGQPGQPLDFHPRVLQHHLPCHRWRSLAQRSPAQSSPQGLLPLHS